MSHGQQFSHLDEQGRASMVDVSKKEITRRVATASCRVVLRPDVVQQLSSLPKGDALAVARIAGVQAAKRTDQWIPLTHQLPLDVVEIDFDLRRDHVVICSRIVCTARTGAEMEALVACSAAALTLYDMVKAVQKDVVVEQLRLDRKSGGRSGDYVRDGLGGSSDAG